MTDTTTFPQVLRRTATAFPGVLRKAVKYNFPNPVQAEALVLSNSASINSMKHVLEKLNDNMSLQSLKDLCRSLDIDEYTIKIFGHSEHKRTYLNCLRDVLKTRIEERQLVQN